LLAKRFGKVNSYDDWTIPRVVDNAIELLTSELPRLAGKINSVHLCFTTDPFMFGVPEVAKISLQSIRLINQYDIKCSVLTKGTLPVELGEYSKKNEYGITLISLDENFRQEIEPGAANYSDRISSLNKLAEMGCQTWVSIEPYPTPNLIDQNLKTILKSVDFVDKIIFGKLNYNKLASSYTKKDEFYKSCVDEVISFCKRKKIAYHIKDGTLKS
jgi:DNA repair photolyase